MKNIKPKVSFVVPVYNKEAYISQCIMSLQAQTVYNIEIIIVNDCSTDGSRDVIGYFADKEQYRVRVIDSIKNVGRSQARNMGNQVARGDIIAVQDADDVSMPNRAEQIIKHFKYHDSDIVYSGFYSVNQFLEPMEEIIPIPFDIQRSLKDRVNYIGHSTMAYKKVCALKVPYKAGDIADLGIDDWLFQLELYKAGFKYGLIDKPLVKYRVLGNTVSGTRSEAEVAACKDAHLKELGLI